MDLFNSAGEVLKALAGEYFYFPLEVFYSVTGDGCFAGRTGKSLLPRLVFEFREIGPIYIFRTWNGRSEKKAIILRRTILKYGKEEDA